MKNKYPVILAFIFVMGCATAPEPTFENGIYSNPEFGFSINLPEGWVNSETISPWIIREIPPSESANLKVLFTSMFPEFGIMSKGRILASCSKLQIPWTDVMAKRDALRKQQLKALSKRKSVLTQRRQIKDYFSGVHALSGHSYPLPFFEEKIDAYEIRAIREGFIYRCQDTETCCIVFYLISPPDKLNRNYTDYRKVVKSLRVH
ncbi:MAG: hypothetical protein PVI06_08750 [Desulfobacterales bacterium]|jgi:hypothetical protein